MAAALAIAVTMSLAGGPAHAQDPCQGGPIYCIPTPTPTPTGTPFQNQNPPPKPEPEPSKGPKKIKPFPVVRTAGTFAGARTTFTRFTVKAPKGTTVRTSCKRAKCRVKKRLTGHKAVHLRKLERTFKAGTRIRLRITKPRRIGKYVEIRVRRGQRPLRQDECLRPSRSRPVAC